MIHSGIEITIALKKFRNSGIHTNDINPILEMEQNARDEIEWMLLEPPDINFVTKLSEYLVTLPLLEESVVNSIMEYNTGEAIHEALSILFNDETSEYEKIDVVSSLNGMDKKYTSYFLDIATRGQYVFYDHNLLVGLREVAHEFLRDDLFTVETVPELMEFMEACRKLNKEFGFSSYAELRGFLWYGYGSSWDFKDC